MAVSYGRLPVHALLLAGVILNAIFSAMIMFVTSIMEPNRSVGTMTWLMGTLTAPSYPALAVLACYLLVYPQPRTRPPNRLGMHRRDQSSGHGTSAALALRQRFLAKAGKESEKSLRQRFQSPPPTHPTSCATNSNSPR